MKFATEARTEKEAKCRGAIAGHEAVFSWVANHFDERQTVPLSGWDAAARAHDVAAKDKVTPEYQAAYYDGLETGAGGAARVVREAQGAGDHAVKSRLITVPVRLRGVEGYGSKKISVTIDVETGLITVSSETFERLNSPDARVADAARGDILAEAKEATEGEPRRVYFDFAEQEAPPSVGGKVYEVRGRTDGKPDGRTISIRKEGDRWVLRGYAVGSSGTTTEGSLADARRRARSAISTGR